MTKDTRVPGPDWLTFRSWAGRIVWLSLCRRVPTCDLSDGILIWRHMCSRDSLFNSMSKVYDPTQRVLFHFYKPGRGWEGLLVVMVFGDRNSRLYFSFKLGFWRTQRPFILNDFSKPHRFL